MCASHFTAPPAAPLHASSLCPQVVALEAGDTTSHVDTGVTTCMLYGNSAPCKPHSGYMARVAAVCSEKGYAGEGVSASPHCAPCAEAKWHSAHTVHELCPHTTHL